MAIKINGTTVIDDNKNGSLQELVLTGTGALKLPVGTTAQQPDPEVGQLRFNSEIANFEGYNGTKWVSIGADDTGYSVGDIRQTYEDISDRTTPLKVVNTLTSFTVATPLRYKQANGILFALRQATTLNYIEDDTVKVTNTLPSGYRWRSVAYGAGKYVLVGFISTTNTGNKMLYSSNAKDWTEVVVPDGKWENIVFTGSLFIAFSTNPAISIQSLDGVTWEPSIPSVTFTTVEYINNRLVGIQYPESIYESLDNGATWEFKATLSSSANEWQYADIIFTNNVYIASVKSGLIKYSTDLINWTSTSKRRNSLYSVGIIFDGSDYIHFSENNSIDVSSDLSTWSINLQDTSLNAYSFIYITQNQYYACLNGLINRVYIGDDPQWAPPKWLPCSGGTLASADYPYLIGKVEYGVKTPELSQISAGTLVYSTVAYGHLGYMYAYSDYQQYDLSADGVTWRVKFGRPSGRAKLALYGNGVYVIQMDDAGGLTTSTDLVTWTNFVYTVYSGRIAYGGGVFVGVGSNGGVYSFDAVNWFNTGLPATNLNNIVYLNNQWIAFYSNSTTGYISFDGIAWKSFTFVRNNIIGLGYVNDTYVDTGSGQYFQTSHNGIDWNARTRNTSINPSYYTGQETASNNRIFVQSTYDGIAYTFNGLEWYTLAGYPGAKISLANNKIFLGTSTGLFAINYYDTSKLRLPKINSIGGTRSFIKVNP